MATSKNFEVKNGLSVAGTERISSAGVGTFTDLNVTGTTTTIDTANLQVKDKNIVINYGSGDTSSTASGAGITIQDAVDASNDATLLWDASSDEFDFSHTVTAPTLTIAGAATFDTSTLVVDATNNRVGIGTASPDAGLQIMNNDGSSYRFGYGGSSDVYLDADSVYIRTDNGGANTATFTTTGLGIGTTSPTQKLDVNGTVELTNLTINGAQGSDGQLLTSTGSGVGWEDAPASGPSKGLAIAFSLIF